MMCSQLFSITCNSTLPAEFRICQTPDILCGSAAEKEMNDENQKEVKLSGRLPFFSLEFWTEWHLLLLSQCVPVNNLCCRSVLFVVCVCVCDCVNMPLCEICHSESGLGSSCQIHDLQEQIISSDSRFLNSQVSQKLKLLKSLTGASFIKLYKF